MSQKSQIPESSPQSIRSGQLNNVQQGIQILTKSLLVTSVVSQYGSPSESNAAVIDEFKLKDLPYLYSALEPFISEKTLRFHHLKHHAKYISTTNSLVKGTEYEGLDLEKVLKKAYVAKNQGLFNNAAQSYNHEFYWNSMKPPSDVPSTPSSKLLQAIDKSFGSLDDFKKQVTICTVYYLYCFLHFNSYYYSLNFCARIIV